MKPIIVLAGQTASGKSDLAIELCKIFNGVIINGDSRQVYKELNISTAKPKLDQNSEIQGVKHYLYDYVSLEEEYNLYKYQKDVKDVLIKIDKEIPFLVGGTGLYIDSVVYNYTLPVHDIENPKDIEIIKKEYGEKLNNSDFNNPRRLSSISRRITLPSKDTPLQHIYLVLDVDKETINKRIEKRVNKMIEEGLEKENRNIYERYKGKELPSLNTVGYKEFIPYFENVLDIDSVIKNIITHTKQYAKRQRTWFRRNKNCIYIKNLQEAKDYIENFLRTE